MNMLPTLLLFAPVVAQTGGTPSPFAFTKTFRVGPHAFTADSGRIEVPENHAQATGRKIQVAVCRLRSSAAKPGVPLFFFPGLPRAATDLRDEGEWASLWARWLPYGDVVLVDHRGSGESQPRLMYDGEDWKPWILYTDEKSAYRHVLNIAARIRQTSARQNINLGVYTTLAAAKDLETVRAALGYERMNLAGHSSGSHLVLTYLRMHPQRVHRMISIGTAGPNDIMKAPSESDRAFERVAALARGQATGGDAYDLSTALPRLLSVLERDPLMITVQDPRNGRTVNLPFGRFGLQLLLIQDLADASDLPDWPRLLSSIEDRKADRVERLVQKRVNGLAELPVVLFTTRAASGASPERWAQIRDESASSLFGRVRTLFCPEIGEALWVPDLGPSFRAPVTSDVPALFISGSLDAHTPPEQAEAVRKGFPNSVHIVFRIAGHDQIVFHPKAHDHMLAFLREDFLKDAEIALPEIRFRPSGGRD